MQVRGSTHKAEGGAVLAALLACLGLGAVVATGRAALALSVVGGVVIATVSLLERRRMAPVAWAAVAFTAPLQGVRVAPILALSDVLIVAALLTILPDAAKGWRRVVPRGVVVAFGTLIGAGLVGTFFAPDVGASLANLVKIVMAAAGSVVAMALWNPEAARLRQFAWLWFAGATTSAIWAAVTPKSFVGRALGLTTHPNHFGLVCVLAVGLGLGLAFSSTGWARATALGGVATLIGGVGLSGSRSAILGLIVTLGFTAILSRRFRLFVAAGAVLVLALMTVIAGFVKLPESHALSRLGGGGGSAASDAQRRETLADAFATISRHPLTGEGFEFAQAAHSIYIQALVVGGPVALVSFLFVCGLIVRAGLCAVNVERKRQSHAVLSGLTAGYAGYLSSNIFDNILWDRYLWTYIGLLIVLASPSRLHGARPPRDHQDRPAPPIVGSSALPSPS